MDSTHALYLLVGILGILIGLISYYASVRGRPNALGRFTMPAIALIIICGILLLAVGFT